MLRKKRLREGLKGGEKGTNKIDLKGNLISYLLIISVLHTLKKDKTENETLGLQLENGNKSHKEVRN